MPCGRTVVARGPGVALVLAVCLLAGACAASTDSGSPTSSLLGQTNATERNAGKAVPGGSLTIGLDAETNDFNPATGQWSPSSYAVANALFDPIVALDEDGNVKPYLAESITANAGFTEWVFKMRPNVTFHDGTPLDAAAVKRNLENVKSSALTGQAFVAIDSMTVSDPLTLTVSLNRPWATFPSTLSTQSGYIVAPAMLDDPAGANAKIVGSGPFTFVDRQRDAYVKTAKNDHYWQKDKDGVALPYLDGLDFRVITDASARARSLEAGDINTMTVGATAEVLTATLEKAERGELQILSNERSETDEVVLALNTTKPPFDDLLARQTLAYAIDQEQMADVAWRGALPGAWGMFREGSPYYISKEEAGYPPHDTGKAKSLAQEYQQKHGAPIQFSALVGSDPDSARVMQAYQAALADVGVKMEIQPVETTQLISKVIVTGDYQASFFALWSSPTPDQGYVFIATPANPNGISLNYSRFDDPGIVTGLDEFRATGDIQKRVAAMKKVQQELAKNLQVLFLAHSVGAYAYSNDVHGFGSPVFPGTTDRAYNPYPTTPFYAYAWRDKA